MDGEAAVHRRMLTDMAGEPNRGTFAVMQPYFFPYAGYYRLLVAAETSSSSTTYSFPAAAARTAARFRVPTARPNG